MRYLEKIFRSNEQRLRDLSNCNFDTLKEAKDSMHDFWHKVSFIDDEMESDKVNIIKQVFELVSYNSLENLIVESRQKVNFIYFVKFLLGKQKPLVSYHIEMTNNAVENIRSQFVHADNVVDTIFELLRKQNRDNEIIHDQVTDVNNQTDDGILDIEAMVEAFHLLLLDVYSTRDEKVSKTVIRDIDRTLYELGFEIIDYDGSNDGDFKVRYYPELKEVKVVSPSIQRLSDKRIVAKGIINKPQK